MVPQGLCYCVEVPVLFRCVLPLRCSRQRDCCCLLKFLCEHDCQRLSEVVVNPFVFVVLCCRGFVCLVWRCRFGLGVVDACDYRGHQLFGWSRPNLCDCDFWGLLKHPIPWLFVISDEVDEFVYSNAPYCAGSLSMICRFHSEWTFEPLIGSVV